MSLYPLFGNKNVEKILFFLFINRSCYAGKLARHFSVPLTPIQHALSKLEKMGLIEKFSEGKLHHFQFNPEYPYLTELEALLRKAYSLLPTDEKRDFYDPQLMTTKETFIPFSKIKAHKVDFSRTLNLLWQHLLKVKNLTFSAVSQGSHPSGWNGLGKGEVQVKKINDHSLIFEEKGVWTSIYEQEFAFSNLFRWTQDPFKKVIILEHLRLGIERPVFLFQLTPLNENTLRSVSSYICNEDSYLGQLKFFSEKIEFNWRIVGPKKNEEISYTYTQ